MISNEYFNILFYEYEKKLSECKTACHVYL